MRQILRSLQIAICKRLLRFFQKMTGVPEKFEIR
jgi:hypothetical protein